MNVRTTPIPDLLLIQPQVFGDTRGFFLETFNRARYKAAGIDHDFVQDNWSRSSMNTLRGLHMQRVNPQGKLVMVVAGTIWDVAVDLRQGSRTFGQWFGAELSGETRAQLWVPPGFAHGFCVLSESADVIYKCTALYQPEDEITLSWKDPTLAIKWPLSGAPLLSRRDHEAPTLAELKP